MTLPEARLEFVSVHGDAFLYDLDLIKVQVGFTWKSALDIIEERVYTDSIFPEILQHLPIDLELAQVYFSYLREKCHTLTQA